MHLSSHLVAGLHEGLAELLALPQQLVSLLLRKAQLGVHLRRVLVKETAHVRHALLQGTCAGRARGFRTLNTTFTSKTKSQTFSNSQE